jgi:predicted TIM-barrel fold metal-dependent hydrolase
VQLIDAQVHLWLADRPSRPWIDSYRETMLERPEFLIHAGQSMGPDRLLLEMAEVGVDGGVLSPVGVYGNDNSFELESARAYPRKFCVVGWIDHTDPAVTETLESDVADGMVGVRILGLREQERHERGEFETALSACERLGCAVSMSLVHPIPAGMFDVVALYEGIQFQIDHLGVGHAPPLLGPAPADPFENLPAVLELARLENVSMKLTGAPSLSHERYPFTDIWPALERIVTAFGPHRVMWGSDFTRTAGLHSYWDATHYLAETGLFSDDELSWLYGRALRTIFDWPDDVHARPLPAKGPQP